ncbi:MAG: CHASE2 domain-containing protein [Bacteriovoracia bacterium]
MKKLWLYQIPIILLFTFGFYVVQQGELGNLQNSFLREKLFPWVRTYSGMLTNLKFQVRGPRKPQHKVVVLEIDDNSLEILGRWPWHREVIGMVVDGAFKMGAKVVALDIMFPEPDPRTSDEVKNFLGEKGLGEAAHAFETDPILADTILKYRDHMILGWAANGHCQPAYDASEECRIVNQPDKTIVPEGFEKYAIQDFKAPAHFDPTKTPLQSVYSLLGNIPIFQDPSRYAGTFDVDPDPDGYVRRISLLRLIHGKPFPTLALEAARVAMDEEIQVEMNDQMLVSAISFKKSGRHLPVTPQGVMEVNFRGPRRTFPYVSIVDMLRELESRDNPEARALASTPATAGASVADILKDAVVLVGPTALGIYDMRAFPFDSNVAGVEGHANIVDNLLSDDAMVNTTVGNAFILIFALMIVGALVFAYYTQKLEAVPALVLFIAFIGGFGFIDFKLLFANQNINWNTSLLYTEYFAIFLLTLAVKYVMEEKDKKFIKSAFGKYVSPALVETIAKDPSKLSLGGDKKELSIMFSDIRSFTTMSEKMDAKHLATFLNDYLGSMTNIVFKTNGTLDKFIGDAVMAFWGAPLDQKTHAANAARAAVEMQKTLIRDHEKYLKEYGIDVQVGVGINTGMVNVGNMGSKTNFNYTVIGDHVNLASRLEGLTKYYGASILVTRNTIDQIEASGEKPPQYRTLDFVKVKGKNDAVELIQLMDFDAPEAGMKVFEEARALYRQRDWDAAIAKFQEADHLLRRVREEADGPCAMYIERCEGFKQEPPEADWDGSWKMTSK